MLLESNAVQPHARMGCRRLYSLNRDRSNYNSELTAVSEIIAENFADVLNKLRELVTP